MDIFLGFLLMLFGGVLGCLVFIYSLGAVLATLSWLVQCPFYLLHGRTPPSWWAYFKGLDGGNQ